MRYIALLRGINVGGNHKVDMKELKELFTSLHFTEVSSYINSGNILFTSPTESIGQIQAILTEAFALHYNFPIPTLIKSSTEMDQIIDVIPTEWTNDKVQKTDIAYLFPEYDDKEILNQLPIKKDYINLRYTPGALYWNVQRDNYNKSHLNKLVSHKLYKYMTIRNINTARKVTAKLHN
ncbi:DUF1697 domain-containing protein [Spirochaeta cellobiosiphila]|uniref:DUF1697 domain-containing protein n=1 Tax=Spirochaeta cellobiosiphila TaxID=504483 RepID=UPI00048C2F7E|nr:DUF1697 domain-containing protein [Spirochaeta cellobiosiphila]